MKARGCFIGTLLVALLAGSSATATATPAAPGWAITALSEPTRFEESVDATCETEVVNGSTLPECNQYTLLATNVGAAATSGAVTVSDTLPAGLRAIRAFIKNEADEAERTPCTGEHTITCVEMHSVVPFENLKVAIDVVVESSLTAGLPMGDEASVSGGGAPPATTSTQTQVGEQAAPLEFVSASLGTWSAGGVPDTQAGDHPAAVTTSFFLSNSFAPTGEVADPLQLLSAEDVRDVVVNLPAGLVGDPQALPRCRLSELRTGSTHNRTFCPSGTEIGLITLRSGGGEAFYGPRSSARAEVAPIYNLVPEGGYPAEFGFDFEGIPVVMHAEVEGPPAYGLRVAIPGQTNLKINGAIVTFFGDPAHQDGAGSPPAAFLTNPSDCGGTPLSATISIDTQQNPGRWISKQTLSYPTLGGCEALTFQPTLSLQPETSQVDTPSGYEVDLRVPQSNNVAPFLATPPLKSATVTLPADVVPSPAASDGLSGCREVGPEGFNVAGAPAGPEGQDLADPEASELGEGHLGGNPSPYDDGLYHTAPGHCPSSSTLGSVEITTPLLESPLRGHVYLAAPRCGAAGQPACSEALAEEGQLLGLYLEVAGSGAIVKLAGKVEVGGEGAHSRETGLAPEQLRVSFANDPQLPFSELKMRFTGGPRAPLANPQTCGTYTSGSLLEPWSAPLSASVLSESSFTLAGCNGFPFSPSFSAGTVETEGGAYAPLTVTFARSDGQQDFSRVTVHTPPGLLGKIAGIPRCDEAQANAGNCGSESQIGTTTVAAGSGSAPLYLSGRVYLTGPYAGRPFGLSVVVPAVAGPFNLGNVVVRASIAIDPQTAALSVVSTPFPQTVDGVAVRLQTVSVDIDRPDFVFNPSNCEQQGIDATIYAAQGASSAVASPFAASGCEKLPFKPSFTASTNGKTSRAGGASLHVRIVYPGGSEANLHKVDVELPKTLPVQDKTLNEACTEAQFIANPAGCPAHSDIAQVTVHTPVLASPLSGPAYLVSHGGAAFPDVEMVLQGEGVTLVVDGKTQIIKGITYSHFETIPDAPISSFEFSAPQGKYALFAANGNLCDQKLKMPTLMVGQNGAVLSQSTAVEVEGCSRSLSVISSKVKKRTLTLSIYAPGAGRVTASGRGVSTGVRTYAGRESLELALKEAKVGRLTTKIKLTFTPSRGKRQSRTVTAKFNV